MIMCTFAESKLIKELILVHLESSDYSVKITSLSEWVTYVVKFQYLLNWQVL